MNAVPLANEWTDTVPDVDPAALPGAENAEFAEFPAVKWDEVGANSANSAGSYVQKAVLPEDSILSDWFNFARERTEGADCYLSGVMLPIIAAMLGRRVWMSLGGERKYPNIFALICGKPGDRKSTTIRIAAALARLCLPSNAFIPASFSPESLFDEYDEERGGMPDKLWVVDDANPVLTDWQKTQNGERNATRFLGLYDCSCLTESFRRNKGESPTGDARRVIAQTSTSIIFGATFNVACFQGQAVRAGMSRRFLYYVAERRGRDIFETHVHGDRALKSLAKRFGGCRKISGAMRFAPDARRRWLAYQAKNRIETDAANPLAEDLICRLASAPAQTLAVAMIFASAMWAKRGGDWRGIVCDEALRFAIEHVAECSGAAEHLDGIAHRATIAEDAEVIFERILRDFAQQRKAETIYVLRSDLTRKVPPRFGPEWRTQTARPLQPIDSRSDQTRKSRYRSERRQAGDLRLSRVRMKNATSVRFQEQNRTKEAFNEQTRRRFETNRREEARSESEKLAEINWPARY